MNKISQFDFKESKKLKTLERKKQRSNKKQSQIFWLNS